MKQLSLLTSLIVMAVCLLFTSCGDKSVTGVTLSQSSVTLEVGETATLTATVAPDNAEDKTVTWSTSNPNVVTVDNGKITAVAPGDEIITVTTKDGNKTATCAVTVTMVMVGPSVSVDFGGNTWTAGGMEAFEEGSEYVFWAGRSSISYTGPYPVLNFIGPKAEGTTTYTEDGEDYYIDYYENKYLSDGTYSFGDWLVQSGTVNITKYADGEMSGTVNAVMFDAKARYEDENENYGTKNLSITFKDVPIQTASKMAMSVKNPRKLDFDKLREKK